MKKISIPGFKEVTIKHLVLDYNGTLAVDGEPISGVKRRLSDLSRDMEIHVLTADTFGTVKQALADVPCTVSIIEPHSQDKAKLHYVAHLGLEETACIGNGRNDHMMLKEAALGIAVILKEGASPAALFSADVVTTSITDALDLFLNPLRLTASLRC
ncbi:MAG: HAD hydrolase family protein [Proteobacteria bacterium]|nr:HAD hydrolase family protein [Pseudomonadota bacterium]